MQSIVAVLPGHRDGFPHPRVYEIPVAPLSAPIDEICLFQISDEVSPFWGHMFSSLIGREDRFRMLYYNIKVQAAREEDVVPRNAVNK